MTGKSNCVIAGVVDYLCLEAGFEREAKRLRIPSREKVADGDSDLVVFSKSDLNDRDPFFIATPPVDGLDVEREYVGGIQPGQDSLKSMIMIDNLDSVWCHYLYQNILSDRCLIESRRKLPAQYQNSIEEINLDPVADVIIDLSMVR